MKKYLLPTTLLLSLFLSGCNSLPSFTTKTDYKSAETVKDLEVPPDLTQPEESDRYAVPESGSATLSNYKQTAQTPAAEQKVLPEVKLAHIEHDGAKRWLVVQGSPDETWAKVKDFLVKSGFVIKVEDAKIGLLETDWAEKRLDAPETGIRKILSDVLKTFYSTAERDRYRVRLERGADGKSTEIFVTHFGLEEVLQNSGGASVTGQTIWQPRPSDPGLEAEMLGKLMVSYGAAESDAAAVAAGKDETKPRAVLAGSAILLDESYDRAWHRVGIALDHSGFTIEDQDRSKGIYFVRYTLPEAKTEESFLSGLAFWKNKPVARAEAYRVMVKAQDSGSLVSVLDKDGNQVNTDATARILNILIEQLK